MIGMKVNIPDFKKLFFNDEFSRKLEAGNKRSLSLFGRNVRRGSRRRIKNARRMPLSSMSQQERRAYKNAQRRAKALGKPAPMRPLQASKPGESPRNRTGKLKQHIYYGLEPERENVIIGPAYLPVRGEGMGAEKLERGGMIRRQKSLRKKLRIGGSGPVRVGDASMIKKGRRDKRGRFIKDAGRGLQEVMPGKFVAYGKIRSAMMLARAERIDRDVFGNNEVEGAMVQLLPRPYMQPSFDQTLTELPRYFTDSVR